MNKKMKEFNDYLTYELRLTPIKQTLMLSIVSVMLSIGVGPTRTYEILYDSFNDALDFALDYITCDLPETNAKTIRQTYSFIYDLDISQEEAYELFRLVHNINYNTDYKHLW